MKKFAISLFALVAISGAAFAAADDNVPAFEHNSFVAGTVDTSALASVVMRKDSNVPNYINQSQLR